jgi:hydrogenase expression/formation protein HypE
LQSGDPLQNPFEGPSCPLPLPHESQIILGHGSGGKLTHRLIQDIFSPAFSNEMLDTGNDFARLEAPHELGSKGHLIVSTDAHIVSPIIFPGGDIGKLAICGTVNDVAMAGAVPLYLTASFILEEGLSIASLTQIVQSMKAAAYEANVKIVAGDTKVVEKGKADGLFISTTGFGWVPEGVHIGGEYAKPGDAVIISGNIGDHGIAVLTARGELGLETGIQSDVAPLNHLIQSVLIAAPNTHVLRDPTRGGLATTLNEIALQSNVCIQLDEKKIPVSPEVKTACEMLGFDPMYIANEGKVIVITPAKEAEKALFALHNHPYGVNAVCIGIVAETPQKRVLMKTPFGGTRILDMLSGEMLPRIC